MAGDGEDPVRQFAAAREAAAAALGEWARRVTAATTEALGKLDPAVLRRWANSIRLSARRLTPGALRWPGTGAAATARAARHTQMTWACVTAELS